MNGMGGSGMTAGGDEVRIPRFVLEDSPKLAKKLKQFEDQQQKAKEAAAVLGDINEISSIKTQAKEARKEADSNLAAANEECERLIEEANEAAQRIIDKATQEANRLTGEAQLRMEDAAEVSAEATKVRSDAATASSLAAQSMKAAEAQDNKLQKRAADLDARELSVQREKEQLAKLSEHIRQTVG